MRRVFHRLCSGSYLGAAYKDHQPIRQVVRAACPRCSRQITTTPDGRLRPHNDRRKP